VQLLDVRCGSGIEPAPMPVLLFWLQPYCTKAKNALKQFLKAEDILVIEVGDVFTYHSH
jgi:hypothetical protein